jgi:hypothetical protein
MVRINATLLGTNALAWIVAAQGTLWRALLLDQHDVVDRSAERFLMVGRVCMIFSVCLAAVAVLLLVLGA